MFPVCDVIPSRTLPFITLLLGGIHSAVFVYELQLDPRDLYTLLRNWGVVPAAFAWPQLLTGLLVHDGWMHLGGNLLCLWLFGQTVEDAIGHIPYLLLYALGGATAAMAHVLVDPASAVPLTGANAAVAAVMGCYFVRYPRSQVLTAVLATWPPDVIEVPAVSFVGLWLVIQVLAGATSLTAPVAGFVGGGVVGMVVRENRW